MPCDEELFLEELERKKRGEGCCPAECGGAEGNCGEDSFVPRWSETIRDVSNNGLQYSVISDGEAELKTQANEARTVKMRIMPVLIMEESASGRVSRRPPHEQAAPSPYWRAYKPVTRRDEAVTEAVLVSRSWPWNDRPLRSQDRLRRI